MKGKRQKGKEIEEKVELVNGKEGWRQKKEEGKAKGRIYEE